MGRLLYPELIENGYPKGFATGLITSSGSVALIILRHRENIQRLLKGTESKFSLKDKKKPE